MLFNGVLGLSVISELTAVLYKVFLCVAVHKDAREHDDKNAVLWTVLTVLFGLLPVIIYAILRYNKSKDFISCPHCGKMVSAKYPVCMFCKQPVNDAPKRDFISEDVKKYFETRNINYHLVSFIKDDFNETDIIERSQNILDGFIAYLKENDLLKS